MGTTRRSFLAAGVTAIAIGGLAGCGSSGETSTGGTFTMAAFPTGNTMDPWKTQISQYVAGATYDTLTHVNADGSVEPWLATSFEYTDPTTLVLKLRSGVTFTDGTDFDADAVKANLEYGKNAVPPNQASQPYLAAIESVETVDPRTVEIKLSAPQPDLPYGFSQQAGWMVSPKALEDPDSLRLGAVGSGPYVLDKAATTANQTYTFTKNSKYWAAEKWPRFDKLVVKLIPDPAASDNAARSGEIDYAIVNAGTKINGWEVTDGAPAAFFGFTIFDVKGKLSKPLGDVRVRQAMNYAIDREAIVKTVLQGDGVVNASTPFGPDSQGYTKALDSRYTYDPEKAKQLLAEAGYASGFTVKVLNNPQWSQMAQAIAGYLRKVGIRVELSDHGSDLVQQTNSGKWPIAMSLQAVTGLPFSDVTGTMTQASALNPLKNSDDTIDSLLRRAATADEASRDEIYRQLSTYAADQAWFVVPALSSQLHGHDPDVVSVTEPKRAGAPMLYHLVPAGRS